MLNTATITIDPGASRLSADAGSLFHGWIMENIDGGYAEYLHRQGVKPFSQYVSPVRGTSIVKWHLSAIDPDAGELLLNPVLARLNADNSIFLRHKGITCRVQEIVRQPGITYHELAGKFFANSGGARWVSLSLATPAAFKSDGRYVFMPDIRLVYQSLLTRWNRYATEVSLEDDHILEQLQEYTSIGSYKLNSRDFHLEGVRIPGFVGTLTFRLHGPDALAGIARLLLAYSSYTGIGIKTSLGMGGVAFADDMQVPGQGAV